jgi:hypothetical protein
MIIATEAQKHGINTLCILCFCAFVQTKICPGRIINKFVQICVIRGKKTTQQSQSLISLHKWQIGLLVIFRLLFDPHFLILTLNQKIWPNLMPTVR